MRIIETLVQYSVYILHHVCNSWTMSQFIKPERTIAQILAKQDNTIADLVKNSKKVGKLNNIVRDCLSEPVRSHCQVVGYQKGCLMIAVDSPEWNHHLRFQVPQVISELRLNHGLVGLVTIKTRVEPLQTAPTPSANLPQIERVPSPEAAESIECIGSEIEDNELKTALLKLAHRLKGND